MRKWYTILLIAVCFAAACKRNKEVIREVDESYTLAPADDGPFGGSMAKKITDAVFTNHIISSNKKTFDVWERGLKKRSVFSDKHLYIILSPSVLAWEEEAEAMKRFIEKGNTLMIVTDYANDKFTDAFSVKLMNEGLDLPYLPPATMRDTYLQLRDSALFTGKHFQYFYHPLHRYISAGAQYQSVRTLAINDLGRPTASHIRIGRGQLIIVTNAKSFSNYFLLSSNNFQYLLGLYAYLPAYPATITWDDFYHRNLYRQPKDYSILSALMAIPALRWAFWILLSLAALWVLSNLRRKQKMIPVLQPNSNTTVSFVQTIAQLYFNKADHANIGRKMTAHFTDQLRSNYYLPPNVQSEEWPALLSNKTGLSMEDARQMTTLMRKAQEDESHFTTEDLLTLHLLIKKVGEKYPTQEKRRRR